MRKLKDFCIRLLCELGKYGVGKSLTLGVYEITVPEKLKKSDTEKH